MMTGVPPLVFLLLGPSARYHLPITLLPAAAALHLLPHALLI